MAHAHTWQCAINAWKLARSRRRTSGFPEIRKIRYPEIQISGGTDARISGKSEVNKSRFRKWQDMQYMKVPVLKHRKYRMIRTLPGCISGAEALISTHSFTAHETTSMLHILHILPFPEPRFVNLGFSGNPGIRASGYSDFRISDFPNFRKSGSSTPAAC